MNGLFSAQTACKVAGISQRCLDYWISTGLVAPHSEYKAPGRRLFLFSYRELVQLRIVSAFRKAGLSLQKIRTSIELVRKERGTDWQACWLVTDGSDAYLARSAAAIEKIGGRHSGQLAFAIVALEETGKQVQTRLLEMRAKAYEPQRPRGKVARHRRVAI